jgi:hypothetical protein
MTDTEAASSKPRHGLSKSRLTAWEQCPRRLWLSVHRPDEAMHDEGAELRFAAGREVGAIACGLLPGGVMIEADPDLRAALAATRRLLDAPAAHPLFEATLEAIMEGRQSPALTLDQLLRMRIPTGWTEQRRALGFNARAD